MTMVMHYAHLFGSNIDSAISVLDQKIPDTIAPELHTEADEPSGDAEAGRAKVVSI